VRGDIVVAIKLQIVEGGGNAEPTRHGGGLKPRNTGFADDNHVSAAHRTANEDDFQFDLSIESQFARAQEENACGTDVARHEGDGEILGAAGNATKAQREAKGRSRILSLFRKYPDGVGRYAGKAAHRIYRLQWHNAQRRHARRNPWAGRKRQRNRLRTTQRSLTDGNG
jgi:hypothetical protein